MLTYMLTCARVCSSFTHVFFCFVFSVQDLYQSLVTEVVTEGIESIYVEVTTLRKIAINVTQSLLLDSIKVRQYIFFRRERERNTHCVRMRERDREGARQEQEDEIDQGKTNNCRCLMSSYLLLLLSFYLQASVPRERGVPDRLFTKALTAMQRERRGYGPCVAHTQALKVCAAIFSALFLLKSLSSSMYYSFFVSCWLSSFWCVFYDCFVSFSIFQVRSVVVFIVFLAYRWHNPFVLRNISDLQMICQPRPQELKR